MNRNEAIRTIREMLAGDGVQREGLQHKSWVKERGMVGEIALSKWRDGVFGLGWEYGYMHGLIAAFDLQKEELYGAWDDPEDSSDDYRDLTDSRYRSDGITLEEQTAPGVWERKPVDRAAWPQGYQKHLPDSTNADHERDPLTDDTPI